MGEFMFRGDYAPYECPYCERICAADAECSCKLAKMERALRALQELERS
jgi:hypothetical protein